LIYNYFRYYDPNTGRYITSDPIGFEGRLNTYGHVEANPLKYVNPLGQDIRVENTTAVNELHQLIVVDVPEGVLIDGRRYDQFGISFGMSSRDFEMQGCFASAVDHPEFGKEGSGAVYPDVSDPTTKVAQEFETTPEEDLMVLKYLLEQLGKTGPYNVFCKSCQNYSQKEFMKTKKIVLNSRGYKLTRHGYESPEELKHHGH
jgi:hypothetical protein